MKNIVFMCLGGVITLLAFIFGQKYLLSEESGLKQAQSSEPEILYWVAPMDANFRRNQPGKSPMGMDLVPVYAKENTGAGIV